MPERWLETNSDALKTVQPFHLGPRLSGQNMAWHQIRLTMARLLWSFDLELDESDPGTRNWPDQRVFGLWETRPLFVNVQERNGL